MKQLIEYAPPGVAQSMEKVVQRYERDRTQALVSRGFSAASVTRWTLTASEKVTAWLQEKAARTDDDAADFGKWKEELANDD